MIRSVSAGLGIALGLAWAGGLSAAGGADRVQQYDVVWNSPSKDASGVMPLGNSDIAADRPMYEICGNRGSVYQVLARKDGGKEIKEISVTAQGGEAALESFEVFEMRSIWSRQTPAK